MKGKLFQLRGNDIEELYYTEDKNLTNDMIKQFYDEFQDSSGYYDELCGEMVNYDSFDEYMEEKHPEVDITRVFVENVFI
jgi:hypothetical protein